MAQHNEIGRIGEDVACETLRKRGHRIISRNYRKKYGEIDIISHERGKLYFWEVKSVSYETHREKSKSVPYETYRPEENVHHKKLLRLSRVIQEYLVSYETKGDWEFGVLVVYLDIENKRAKVRTISNIVIGA